VRFVLIPARSVHSTTSQKFREVDRRVLLLLPLSLPGGVGVAWRNALITWICARVRALRDCSGRSWLSISWSIDARRVMICWVAELLISLTFLHVLVYLLVLTGRTSEFLNIETCLWCTCRG